MRSSLKSVISPTAYVIYRLDLDLEPTSNVSMTDPEEVKLHVCLDYALRTPETLAQSHSLTFTCKRI
jgi:hypothetical protein